MEEVTKAPTPDEAAAMMRGIVQQSEIDPEQAHIDADTLLACILSFTGYEKTVEEFNKVERWYA